MYLYAFCCYYIAILATLETHSCDNLEMLDDYCTLYTVHRLSLDQGFRKIVRFNKKKVNIILFLIIYLLFILLVVWCVRSVSFSVSASPLYLSGKLCLPARIVLTWIGKCGSSFNCFTAVFSVKNSTCMTRWSLVSFLYRMYRILYRNRNGVVWGTKPVVFCVLCHSFFFVNTPIHEGHDILSGSMKPSNISKASLGIQSAVCHLDIIG